MHMLCRRITQIVFHLSIGVDEHPYPLGLFVVLTRTCPRFQAQSVQVNTCHLLLFPTIGLKSRVFGSFSPLTFWSLKSIPI